MAIYHCSVKLVKRSEGRSATAAAAYRSGDRIVDERTGEIHDYTHRSGVESTELVFPDHVTTGPDRERLWNTAETAETRKNAQVAREVEIALPDELTAEQRRELAVDFARQIAERYNVAADVCIHKPGKEGDQRNHHAHILLTTRTIESDGTLGKKTRILDDQKTGPAEVQKIREMWAQVCNASLEKSGHAERVDHRSLREQGEERPATKHQGPAVTAIERKNVRAVIRREFEDQRLEHIITLDEYTQQRRADGNIPAITRIGEINQTVRELERLEAKKPNAADIRREAEWQQERANIEPTLERDDPTARPRPDVLSPQEELTRALRDAGLVIEGEPIMDGNIQRVPVVGGRPGARDGYYCAAMTGDHPNGWWQNHRTGARSKWIYTAHILTDEARERLRRENAEKLKEREEERRRASQVKQEERPQPPQQQEAERSQQASRDDDEWER